MVLTGRAGIRWSVLRRHRRRSQGRRNEGRAPQKSGKYFSGKYHENFGHFVNFSCIAFLAKMSRPPKLAELLRLRRTSCRNRSRLADRSRRRRTQLGRGQELSADERTSRINVSSRSAAASYALAQWRQLCRSPTPDVSRVKS